MNERFAEIVDATPQLYERLKASQPYIIGQGLAGYRGMAGIYVFYEVQKAVHVGRTRDLVRAVRGHVTRSHYPATHAFNRQASHTAMSCRAHSLKGPGVSRRAFPPRFEWIKMGQFKIDHTQHMRAYSSGWQRFASA